MIPAPVVSRAGNVVYSTTGSGPVRWMVSFRSKTPAQGVCRAIRSLSNAATSTDGEETDVDVCFDGSNKVVVMVDRCLCELQLRSDLLKRYSWSCLAFNGRRISRFRCRNSRENSSKSLITSTGADVGVLTSDMEIDEGGADIPSHNLMERHYRSGVIPLQGRNGHSVP
ncbi:hypothetical protein L1987_20884 [Smallanthus sonchifolius]|uniref:Uncharacterized protein n=1 Tax=Smallanthus sonchifolius TaxID=185202 RepID=A0ACB9IUI9_9ASTR|nr:hypothetical protein L1987_20884 [Smallanthus sonchifolius]